MGLSAGRNVLTVDQLFAAVVTDADDASIDIPSGLVTTTGGTLSGGDGKDPDGADISMTEVAVLHLRNTGTTAIKISITTYDGVADVIKDFPIVAGGEFFISSQQAVADGLLTVNPAVALEKVSFQLNCLGKI